MKRFFLLFYIICLSCNPIFAQKQEYFIRKDSEYNTSFLCFSKNECYYTTPTVVKIKNKSFVAFGGFQYYDIDSYKYNSQTDTYSVDIMVDRDPLTDLDICNKSPFDNGNIIHLIFLIEYTPSKKYFSAKYKGFATSEDELVYNNGKPKYITTKYLNIYYDNNPEGLKDLSNWLKFFNKDVVKTLGKPNDSIDYDIEIEYIIPYYIRNL